ARAAGGHAAREVALEVAVEQATAAAEAERRALEPRLLAGDGRAVGLAVRGEGVGVVAELQAGEDAAGEVVRAPDALRAVSTGGGAGHRALELRLHARDGAAVGLGVRGDVREGVHAGEGGAVRRALC